MLYYLFDYINKYSALPGFKIIPVPNIQFCIGRNNSIIPCILPRPKIIKILQKHQIGEAKKEDGPKSHWSKAGTPTMGGIILILSIVVPVLLWGDIKSIYVILILAGTVWLSGSRIS